MRHAAVAALDVQWKKRYTMGVAILDRDELEEEYAAAMEAAGEMGREEAAIQFANQLAEPSSTADKCTKQRIRYE